MKNKKYNGFASEEQYLEAFEKFKNVQESEDTYDRDTIALYKEDDTIEFVVGNYSITLWGGTVEVNINKDGIRFVDGGIVSIAAALMEDGYNGEFDEYFKED